MKVYRKLPHSTFSKYYLAIIRHYSASRLDLCKEGTRRESLINYIVDSFNY